PTARKPILESSEPTLRHRSVSTSPASGSRSLLLSRLASDGQRDGPSAGPRLRRRHLATRCCCDRLDRENWFQLVDELLGDSVQVLFDGHALLHLTIGPSSAPKVMGPHLRTECHRQ